MSKNVGKLRFSSTPLGKLRAGSMRVDIKKTWVVFLPIKALFSSLELIPPHLARSER
jgi:hypothetical protein